MKKLVLAIVVIFAVAVLFGCSNGAKSGSSVYKVELEGNPTTGYTWQYKMNPEGIVKEVKNEYVEDKQSGDAVGVGGKYVFEFEGVKAGEVTLEFRYARSWEDEEPSDQKTIVLKVDDKLNVEAV